MAERMSCDVCGNIGYQKNFDGAYYCIECGVQSQEMFDMKNEEAEDIGLRSTFTRTIRSRVKMEPRTLTQLQSPFFNPSFVNNVKQEHPQPYEDKITLPTDFGNSRFAMMSADEIAESIRMVYISGIQLMIQMQCKSLVENFGANAMICGVVGPIWLRFLAQSGVCKKEWASQMILESEMAFQNRSIEGQEVGKSSGTQPKPSTEPCNIYGQRAVIVWIKALRKIIPLSSTLAIVFLACHMSRESILPTDILAWALEGKLPYMAAFVDIENILKPFPLSSRILFRPVRPVGSWQLESLAASIAVAIGLNLPPVNFYGIASRYLKQLSLPTKILKHACRIYEWLMPPDLWLSTNLLRLPTRCCVMAILVVSIRLLYDINGWGKWEKSLDCKKRSISSLSEKINQKSEEGTLSDKGCNSMSMNGTATMSLGHDQNSELDTTQLLCNLDIIYDKLGTSKGYMKDLPSYLKYCRDIIFAGLSSSYDEDTIIQELWRIYEDHEDVKPQLQEGNTFGMPKRKRFQEKEQETKMPEKEQTCTMKESVQTFKDIQLSEEHEDIPMQENVDEDSKESFSIPQVSDNNLLNAREILINKLKVDMEENWFHYLPPRDSFQKREYIHYRRRKHGGTLNYVAHADYYILLRACARIVELDIRLMHLGVLKLERRLSWVENHIDNSLHSILEISNEDGQTNSESLKDLLSVKSSN